MTKNFPLRVFAAALVSLVYVLIAIGIISWVTTQFVDKQIVQIKESLQSEVSTVRHNIESVVFRDTFLADSLATVVTIDQEFALKNWEDIASKLLAKSTYVRNVGIAPNDVILKVYPIAGNEAAIGFDFRTRPEQYETVQKARQSQSVYIDGPLELVQGGRALIARYPIFSDAPYNTVYWGTVSVVMNYDPLITESGLAELESLDLAIAGKNNSNQLDKLIFGEQATIDKADFNYSIFVPNGSWSIYARYQNLENNSYTRSTKTLFQTLGGITFTAGYLLIALLFKNYSRIQNASLLDELTQLPNRRFLSRELNKLLANKNSKSKFTVLLIDLNDFKQVNDTLGHETGDELLVHVAKSIRDSVRATDIVARIGGDEFVIVLQNTKQTANIEKVIQKIKQDLRSNPLSVHDTTIHPSFSVGYTSYTNDGAHKP